MNKRILWLVVSGLMAVSLVMVACSAATTTSTTATTQTTTTSTTTVATPTTPTSPTTPTTPSAEVPKYGGTLTLCISVDATGTSLDPQLAKESVTGLVYQRLWSGDWTKGAAGGYGTNQTDWRGRYDLFDLKMGYIAEKINWTTDSANNAGTIVYEIRQGVHYGLNSNSEASRLVNGRTVTTDDVIFGLKRAISNSQAFIYQSNPDLRTANITKTGPWEVTVQVPLASMVQALSRFGEATNTAPSEVVQKYGDMTNWKNSVGTGPFMLTDYVSGSSITLVRNPNYWMKDPIGPGKGNQLPYLDGVTILIIPDASTKLAALRTGKVDQMGGQMTGNMGLSYDDATTMEKTAPQLLHAQGEYGAMSPTYFNTTKAPFTDVRVRQAMLMATDLESIRQSLNHGLGQILTFPFEYTKTYADLYMGLDDPEMPASVKDLYTYNPDKAKKLLADAGYPNGFKTSILITSSSVDYFSIMKDMWAKVGIDLTLDIRDAVVVTNLMTNRDYQMATGGRAPVGIFYLLSNLTGQATTNGSVVNDPVINDGITKVRQACITDMHQGMHLFKEMMPYVLGQAYAIPMPANPLTIYWWPWLKNYSGETCVGMESGNAWAQWIWYDQALKKSMGH